MIVKCIMFHDYLEYGKQYKVIDRSEDSFKVVNRAGNYDWINMKYFNGSR